ncbi:MAG TPA: SPASM domain-containing protein, partial [Candidatus Deferrimicrobiaceae bacterium]
VKPNGEITPCGFIPVTIGHILRDDFAEVWHHSKVLDHLRNKAATGKCTGCAKFSACLGGCTARAYAVYGAYDAPDPHCWAAGGGHSSPPPPPDQECPPER